MAHWIQGKCQSNGKKKTKIIQNKVKRDKSNNKNKAEQKQTKQLK